MNALCICNTFMATCSDTQQHGDSEVIYNSLKVEEPILYYELSSERF